MCGKPCFLFICAIKDRAILKNHKLKKYLFIIYEKLLIMIIIKIQIKTYWSAKSIHLINSKQKRSSFRHILSKLYNSSSIGNMSDENV